MKSLLITIITVMFAFAAFSQQTNKTISGLIKDIQNEPVTEATVSLLRAADSSIVQTKPARDNGKFEFAGLINGSYLLTISSTGNLKYISASLTIDDAHLNIVFPVIILLPSKKTDLKEVIVTAKKPLIEQDIDKTIVNVESMLSAATSNTLEVLEKTPGITIGTDGEISLNGKSGVLVLIDGRPTYMSGQDLASYLKSLPGGSIDKIELMTNPPAKYDAAGSAVINIRLKRNRLQGFTGNISLNYSHGWRGRSYNSLNLNYLRKKINMFGNISYSKDGNRGEDLGTRIFYNSNNAKLSSIHQENVSLYNANDLTIRLGMDYMYSPNTTFGIIVSKNRRPRTERFDYTNNSYDAIDILDSVGTGITDGNYRWRQNSANFNFQQKLGSVGQEISADLSYINYKNSGEQLLQNYVYTSSGVIDDEYSFLYTLPSGINIYSAKADYSVPFKNNIKFSAGLKSSLVNNDNKAEYFNISNNTTDPDYGKSNHFKYRENINAVYVNGRRDGKRFGMQLGLRAENTILKGHQLGNAVVQETIFTRTYTRLFPTVFLSYKLDSVGKSTLALSYSRRLIRPNYQQLNPFLFFRDQYSYSSGNPYLNPTYNNTFDLKYSYKQFLSVAFQFDQLSDNVFSATRTVDNIFITQPQNMASGHMLAVQVNLNFTPIKWWTCNLNLATAQFAIRGYAYEEAIDLKMQAYRVNAFNQFRIAKDWNAEMTFQYISKIITWGRVKEGRYRFNTGFQKKVLKGKGSLKLTFEDIMRSWIDKETILGIKQVESYHTYYGDNRRVGLAFSLGFGKETFARKRRHTDNSADDVKGRVE